jgi:hypothetical protein
MMKPVEYFVQTRGDQCEHCGSAFTFSNRPERHHCIHGRVKGKPEFDEPVNIELVCHNCHQSGEVDSFEHRKEFAMRQINRGYDVVAWVESLNLKAPEQWLLEL